MFPSIGSLPYTAAMSALDPRHYQGLQCYLDPADVSQQRQRGTAVLANSATNYLRVADNPALAFSDKMSVSFWMRPDAVNVLDRQIMGQCSNNPGSVTNLAWAVASGGSTNQGDEIRFICGQTGGAAAVTPNGTITLVAGQWVHVVCVWDGTLADAAKVAIYADGVARTTIISGTWPSTLFNSTAELGIGNRLHSAWSSFAGAVSDVALFNVALDATQVGYLYDAAHGNHYAQGAWASHDAGLPDPVTFWPLAERSGTREDDAGSLDLTESAAAITGTKHAIIVFDKSPRRLRFGDQSIDRRKSAPDWIGDGINGRPCWEGVTFVRYLCAHFPKNSWCAKATGDVFMVVRPMTTLSGEHLLLWSASHEDSYDEDPAFDNHIGVLMSSTSGKCVWRYQGDVGPVNSADSSTKADFAAGNTYLLNFRHTGADTLLRVNGVETVVTDDGGDGKGHFFDEGTLRTNFSLQIIRRLNASGINTSGIGTHRYGECAVFGPALPLAHNRLVEKGMAMRAGIALPS